MRSQELVIATGNVFVATNALGDISPDEPHGLFAADTRFLCRYRLRLDGLRPILLRSGRAGTAEQHVYATNAHGAEVPAHAVEIVRRQRLNGTFVERIELTNRGLAPLELPLTLELDADFADIFELRSLARGRGAGRDLRRSKDDHLVFVDRRRTRKRVTRVRFSREPDEVRRGVALFTVRLAPQASWSIDVEIGWTAARPAMARRPIPIARMDDGAAADAAVRQAPRLETDDRDLRHAYETAVHDLASLEIALDTGYRLPAAGLPWFLTIFGRDSIITSLQSLLLGPDLAIGTLRALAAYQARRASAARDAEPGKIVHEIRFGELAESGKFPHARYYGTVDATPLWLILLAETYRWTGDQALLTDLMPAADRALRWIDDCGDLDGDGLVEYQRRSRRGLTNQGWKDSWDSIRFADGRFAEGPIALVEVQGYVYAAKRALAELYEVVGRREEARRLRDDAARLKSLVQDAFWLPAEGFYALALDRHKRPVDSLTSNPGHLLWSGLPDATYAARVVERLMAPDFFTGWGVRTMASGMAAYSPISYHNGSVWPHDNSLLVAGFRRYGFARDAVRLSDALIAASSCFDQHRLPELFCGYDRDGTPFPVDYPVACSPQAWAAGSVVLMVQELAGIELEPGRETLRVIPPLQERTLHLYGVPFRGALHDLPPRPPSVIRLPRQPSGLAVPRA